MAKVICTKCGTMGHSKCPVCRSVFLDNPLVASFGHYFGSFSKLEDSGIVHLTIALYGEEDSCPEDLAVDLFGRISQLVARGEFTWKEVVCWHDWRFAPGEKSDIGCGCLQE